MKRVLPSALVGWFLSYAQRLEHPQLFKWICAIFLVDLFIPDLLPFVDEFLLGLATLYLASRKKRRPEKPGQHQQEKFAGKGKGERVKEDPRT
ncbi:DUF6116 family protein [Microbulbifer marinus]|uniref:Uncharacterized protein n=1 Tax=Microbulbifer marinus TaxID=658218 RepID=A0A1H4BQ25_9GAMM|nr:DUF6116 family protein [Microbulbifer marinus]SEA50229.1 hypothetical protein SAMN05216562_3397 [Microbulbifer marinus]